MYATAHRVINDSGTEGINAFLHLHGPILWPAMAFRMPEEQPGQIIHETISVPPGGNRIRSYLDVLAPDSCSLETVETVLRRVWLELVNDAVNKKAQAQSDRLLWALLPNPIGYVCDGVSIRFGVDDTLAMDRAGEFEILHQKVSSLLLQTTWRAAA